MVSLYKVGETKSLIIAVCLLVCGHHQNPDYHHRHSHHHNHDYHHRHSHHHNHDYHHRHSHHHNHDYHHDDNYHRNYHLRFRRRYIVAIVVDGVIALTI